MTLKRAGEERFSLGRWSRRKLQSALEKAAPATQPPAAPAPVPVAPASAAGGAPVGLPPVESLTFDSDFTAFMRPEVDPAVKQAAVKRLLRDPRFNVMDGLDVYIDDYTKADPIPPDMLGKLLERFDFREPASGAPAPAGPPEAIAESPAASADVAPQVAQATTSEPALRPTAARPSTSQDPAAAAHPDGTQADGARSPPDAAGSDAVRPAPPDRP